MDYTGSRGWLRVEGESVVGSSTRWEELLLLFCGVIHIAQWYPTTQFYFLVSGYWFTWIGALSSTMNHSIVLCLHVEKHQLSVCSSHRRTWSSLSDSESLSQQLRAKRWDPSWEIEAYNGDDVGSGLLDSLPVDGFISGAWVDCVGECEVSS